MPVNGEKIKEMVGYIGSGTTIKHKHYGLPQKLDTRFWGSVYGKVDIHNFLQRAVMGNTTCFDNVPFFMKGTYFAILKIQA